MLLGIFSARAFETVATFLVEAVLQVGKRPEEWYEVCQAALPGHPSLRSLEFSGLAICVLQRCLRVVASPKQSSATRSHLAAYTAGRKAVKKP